MAFKTSPQVRYCRDTYAEHPEDRKNIEYSVHLDNDEDLVTLSGLYEQIKHLDEAFKLGYARWVILLSKYDEILFFFCSECPLLTRKPHGNVISTTC